MVETMRLMKEHEMEADDLKFSPENLAKLIELADAGTINSSVAKKYLRRSSWKTLILISTWKSTD